VRIAEVVARLTEITQWARRTDSRLGFFAALYRTVTIEVQRGIEVGRFADAARMERLDVIFARRYLDAFDSYQQGEPVSRSWRIAFDASARWRPIVLQHLLLGINAHINLDLGVAAATVAPGASLNTLRSDFDEINAVLGGLIAAVQLEIAAVSPWINLLSAVAGGADGELVGFNLRVSRKVAWEVANRLAPLNQSDWQPHINAIDLQAALLGRAIATPPLLTAAALLAVRVREASTTARVIDVLMDVHPLPYDLTRDDILAPATL
jgi:hypothetical protein